MALQSISIQTSGEGFYDFSEHVQGWLVENPIRSGLLYLFVQHTSCALTITEAFDPSAKADVEEFLKRIAPRNADWIQHRLEGPDDSPSHMKSILLHQHLCLPVEEGELMLGTWQGVYLAEFRDAPHSRKVWIKTVSDEK